MKKNSAKIFSSGEHKLVSLAKFGAFVFTKPGLALIRKVVRKKLAGGQRETQSPIDYHSWLKKNAAQHPQKSTGPKISILLTVTPCQEYELLRAVVSVLGQNYDNWELIVDRQVGSNALLSLAQMTPNDRRIVLSTECSDSTAPASCATAGGEYVMWMQSTDEMVPACLSVLAGYISNNAGADLIYADEGLITHDKNVVLGDPFFKPGWSPHTLLSRNYIGHNIVAKKSLATAYAASADSFYDLVLRLTEQARQVSHIPAVLSHSSIPPFHDTPGTLAKKALAVALQRRGLNGTLNDVPGAQGCYHIDYAIKEQEKVSIIIPTKDNTELLQKTVDSIFQKTEYPNYEVIVLDNNSTSSAFFKLMEDYSASHPGKFRCVEASFPFNFAKLMNMGAQLSTGAYLLMCNNDIEVLHADWMTQMVAQAQQQHTGAVGVKLLFPDDTIQHTGIVLGGEEASEHIFAHRSKDDDGYFFSLKATTNYAAVTAACLMCRKTVFEQVGGMDEALAVEYNDVDLCLKFLKAGYYNVLLPSVVLYHYESATRGHPFRSKASWQQHENELKLFLQRWKSLIDKDPYYNKAREQEFVYKPIVEM